MHLFFSDKQLFVGAVDADCSKRCGDQSTICPQASPMESGTEPIAA